MITRDKTTDRKRGTPRLPIHKLAARKDTGVALNTAANTHAAAGSSPNDSSQAGPLPSLAALAMVEPRPNADPTQVTPTQPAAQRLDFSTEKLLTVKEAAYRLGKSSSIIREWLHAGRLRGWQPGGPRCSLMVSEASVEEMLVYTVPITRKRWKS